MKSKDYYVDLISCIGNIDNGTTPCTWEEFLKCGEIIFGIITRTVGDFKVYRANFIRELNDRLDKVSGFSYPPKGAPMGRCNLENKPVFYCTPSFLGAIHETIITRKDDKVLNDYNYIIYISEWEMKKPLRCNIYDTSNNLDLVFYDEKDRNEKRDIEVYQRLYQNFINKVFRSPRGHEISANFSDMLMYSADGFNNSESTEAPSLIKPCKFIIYKSVAKDGFFTNMAIHHSIIDSKILKFNKVLKIKLPLLNYYEMINTTQLNFEVLKTGINLDQKSDNIVWREPVESDYKYI